MTVTVDDPARPSATTTADRERWVALGVLCAAFLMIRLDTTIVNVALPSIQGDLGFSQSGLAWVVNAYLVPFGGLLLLAGRLGDLVGRRSVFLSGLTVFLGASLLCGLAQSQELLIGARFLQGIGGALTSAVILGMIVALFPEPAGQARAIGAYAFVGSAGASLGLVLGGLLTEAISWHWIFFVNLPIGVATGVAARRVLEREAGPGLRAGADVGGAVLIVAASMLGVYAIVAARDHGWGSATTLWLGAVALALLGAFAAREARASAPLVALRVFGSRALSAANVVQVLMIAGMFGQQFIFALYLQRVLGFSPSEVGLGSAPIALAIGVASLGFSARLILRVGPKAVLLVALVLMAAGLTLFALAPVDGVYARDLLPGMLVAGAGAGLAMPALTTIAMAGAAPRDAGLASGLINTTQQIGAALGLATLATLSASRTDTLRARGDAVAEALTGGYHVGFAVAAGFIAAAFVAAAVLLPAPTPEPTDPVAGRSASRGPS
jgi:EmrB/QacA subfamily drug resistance transporter